jgi:hypothetical protein
MAGRHDRGLIALLSSGEVHPAIWVRFSRKKRGSWGHYCLGQCSGSTHPDQAPYSPG